MTDIVNAVHQLGLPLAEGSGGWAPYPLFRGRTELLDFVGCHVSVLSPGCSPHPPHSHIEEEILIVLDGEAEIVIASREDDPEPRIERLRPAQFSYYPAWQFHTLRNVSVAPVTYMMFKWSGPRAQTNLRMKANTFNPNALLSQIDDKPVSSRMLFEGPTEWLTRLHCHVTTLLPGAGYDPHADDYDVAIVALAGTIDTLGSTVVAPGAVYYCKGSLHGIRNPADQPARYLVFEFERFDPR
jgi:mannose-6-phosphate isomerase-like protein (cupin superfamily)